MTVSISCSVCIVELLSLCGELISSVKKLHLRIPVKLSGPAKRRSVHVERFWGLWGAEGRRRNYKVVLCKKAASGRVVGDGTTQQFFTPTSFPALTWCTSSHQVTRTHWRIFNCPTWFLLVYRYLPESKLLILVWWTNQRSNFIIVSDSPRSCRQIYSLIAVLLFKNKKTFLLP